MGVAVQEFLYQGIVCKAILLISYALMSYKFFVYLYQTSTEIQFAQDCGADPFNQEFTIIQYANGFTSEYFLDQDGFRNKNKLFVPIKDYNT